jgi:hypothetical protein
MIREISAYFFRKNVLENRKTTLRRRKEGTEKPVVFSTHQIAESKSGTTGILVKMGHSVE